MKQIICAGLACLAIGFLYAQKTFPVNGVADERNTIYVLKNATVYKDAETVIPGATLVVQKDRIIDIGTNITAPAGAVIIDCSGRFILPSFVDIYSDYGIPVPQRAAGAFNFSAPAQFNSNTKGAVGWNQAVRAEVDAVNIFTSDEKQAKTFRDIGFGTVLTHQKDGIVRGTGAVVTLANEKENLAIVKEKAAMHFSFSKGTSTQSYPGSLMGVIALLRQTYIDAEWYKNNPAAEGVNLSLKAFNENASLPQVFEANDKWGDLRADRIGDEFGKQYIIKGGGNEYQRINEIAATKASFILPLNFPEAMDVEDPNNAYQVSLNDLKHWELAPGNPAAFEKAGIPFCLTPADLRDIKQFLPNLRKAIASGLSEKQALKALTQTPAELMGVYHLVGSLEKGKLANFLVSSGPVFNEKTVIFENWVQGQKYTVKDDDEAIKGTYNLTVQSGGKTETYTLVVKDPSSASITGKDTLNAKFTYNNKLVTLSFPPSKKSKNSIRLSGIALGNEWSGNGADTAGNAVFWKAGLTAAAVAVKDSGSKSAPAAALAKITYPFGSYGFDKLPEQQTILIKNATVWTSDIAGKLENTDVLVRSGKIEQVGKNLNASGAVILDGTGKHLTAGIIDEHSHIAVASINEGAQSVTSEVRIADNLNPDDINIYRQLSGGVTSSHILHGSANTIGGQTQLIKLRWGADAEGLKFKNWDPFIKFALGENVKRTTSSANNRFPDTRMGVEQVLTDAFQRAVDYQNAVKAAGTVSAKGRKGAAANPWATVRRDLELDALVEILNAQRFITCHSYVQTEITYMMRVAEKFGFKVNTLTHILEGYKVADKINAHGASVSTFSDWFGYKMEVLDAIAYNAGIMQKMGLNVCINSDDAEMARRLNQEAAKIIKYSSITEEQALNMVTINPAKALHIDDRTGSIKAGKDADLVLWSDHPLSIYAQAEKTIVDGIIYFDRERDLQLRKSITEERNRLIQKMNGEKKAGGRTAPFRPSTQALLGCGEHDDDGSFHLHDDEQAAAW
ncbi:MAG: amidohydrolase family protein [Chitinophagaceae bacterium]|nr:amidohydrolase family protein [Chitinophagaceae bacterium]MCW5928588.1 amidohydrolase family protein [Chitinophagaceae bacterium]